ncbi:MAG TPA: hypothetical protein VFB31_02070 [Pseudolabrys sp.]|nr:hypothetical protein [Pseudolabrys sp.]
MRRTMLVAAAALALSAGALLPGRAEAMTVAAPVGMQAAIGDTLTQDVAYVCQPVWRCGYWGCGWRRACWWTGPGPYYWRHRYWRRHYWRYW